MFRAENLARSLAELGARPSLSIFTELKDAYAHPARYYHTVRHIADCLTLFQDVRHLATRPAEVEIALWFHDAVYDTRRQDNEEQSAEWAIRFLEEVSVAYDVSNRIARLILATKDHVAHDADAALITDIDLCILGAPALVFDQYDSNIRREYHWVPEEPFRQGRRQVLEGFLKRPAIYHTKYFQAHYEQQARINLQRKVQEFNV
ncbi:MAG: N-methyl-D-aspartate receptor NMDAR2C subunit [Candidatus Electrothrix aestuarii]|uniref:N-methyl-D-aspartate receptor NMDAR2C subunit n=1 Tax=Candidatus Electrothrix aestuarii TaxID=3062594 RepID=A0AAU8LWH3_9BACT|nr:hypothetical protein [Candidatus Electrothrix aestuarii]